MPATVSVPPELMSSREPELMLRVTPEGTKTSTPSGISSTSPGPTVMFGIVQVSTFHVPPNVDTQVLSSMIPPVAYAS